MKGILAGLAVAAIAGCAAEPDWRKSERAITEQEYPEARNDHWVSPPTPYEEMRDLTAKMRSEGWSVADVEPAGKEFPAKYLVTFQR